MEYEGEAGRNLTGFFSFSAGIREEKVNYSYRSAFG